MSIGFVVGGLVLCSIFGFEKLAKFFALAFFIGITIAQPWLLVVWAGIFFLALSRS